MDATLRKQNGVHYTPPALADFLARQTVACINPAQSEPIAMLDPACGDGQLLASLIDALPARGLRIGKVVGLDTDPNAVALAKERLERFGIPDLSIHRQDFLQGDFSSQSFDCVIANPPYVRTQNLGGAAAQLLAKKFQLKGRLDLYQAFTVAISSVMRPGGALGLLTSNRFLTVRSGAAMRGLLRQYFDLHQIFDLGDTRLFDAAVLPAVVTGTKRGLQVDASHQPVFHRVYCIDGSLADGDAATLLPAIEDPGVCGEFETTGGSFLIERGELLAEDHGSVWTLENSMTRRWLDCVRASQVNRFGDLAEVKVGIKTTADAVFIGEQWDSLENSKPEDVLLKSLITHHDASRWSISTPRKSVLYPYDLARQKRTPIELGDFPKSQAYLEQYRDRLESRKYVVDSGRHWYEIWVPQQPADWAKPKIVWPDISEQPKFFLDSSGAIVNGDCYWIKLRPAVDPDWLYLMLAVANSSIATKFYDTVFHNKLYAGRRRFMTQYVMEFPLPALESKLGREIVNLAKRLVERPDKPNEASVEAKVQQAFGLRAAKR